MLREGRICPQDSQTDDVTLTAESDTIGEPVHQIQTGFFSGPEFTVFRARDVRLVIAKPEPRISGVSITAGSGRFPDHFPPGNWQPAADGSSPIPCYGSVLGPEIRKIRCQINEKQSQYCDLRASKIVPKLDEC